MNTAVCLRLFVMSALMGTTSTMHSQTNRSTTESALWEKTTGGLNKKFTDCIDRGDYNCNDQLREDWEKQLNVEYKKLMDVLDTAQQAKLRSAQRAWLAFRTKEVAFLDSRVDPIAEGAMGQDASTGDVLNVTQKRVEELHGYLMFALYRMEDESWK